MLSLLFAAAVLWEPQNFDGLTIDFPAKATLVNSTTGRKIWEARQEQTFAGGQKATVHTMLVGVMDFAALQSTPTEGQMLDLAEENFRRRFGYNSVFAKRTEGKAGTSKAVMLYGYGRDATGNAKTLVGAAIVKSRKMYEVMWATDSHLRDVPLASITGIKFEGAPVAGWKPTAEGEYSMTGYPFAVSGKLFIGTEPVKPERGYPGGYVASTLTGKDAVADTRFVAVRLKADDKRADSEIFKDLATLASSPLPSDKLPEIVNGTADKTIEFEDVFGSRVVARVVFLRKGDFAGLLSASGDKSPELVAELKKPTLRFLATGK